MNARMYRYFAAATVALALGVALFADGDMPAAPMTEDEDTPPVIQPAPTAEVPEPIEQIETFTDIAPDGSFGQPMMTVEGDADGESQDAFGQPQMEVAPDGM